LAKGSIGYGLCLVKVSRGEECGGGSRENGGGGQVAEHAGGDNEDGTDGEKGGAGGEGGTRDAGAGNDGGNPNHDACKGLQALPVSPMKAAAGTFHQAPVQTGGGIAPPVLGLVAGGTARS